MDRFYNLYETCEGVFGPMSESEKNNLNQNLVIKHTFVKCDRSRTFFTQIK